MNKELSIIIILLFSMFNTIKAQQQEEIESIKRKMSYVFRRFSHTNEPTIVSLTSSCQVSISGQLFGNNIRNVKIPLDKDWRVEALKYAADDLRADKMSFTNDDDDFIFLVNGQPQPKFTIYNPTDSRFDVYIFLSALRAMRDYVHKYGCNALP